MRRVFTHSLYVNLLSSYYVSGTVTGGRDTAGNKIPTPRQLLFQPSQFGEERINK